MSNESWDMWLLLAGAIAGTYVWRGLGALFSRRVNPEGAVFQWITCVSYAMLAGLISRMVWIPIGPLTEVALWIRLLGLLVGLVVFFMLGRRLLAGVGAGLVVFIALQSLG